MLIDLALKFDKKSLLREPLSNYRFIAQYSNITSLEYIVTYYAKAAEEKHEGVAKLANDEVKYLLLVMEK